MIGIQLDGRTAFVTGGGRGIGEACARALAGAGAKVVIADRRGEGAAAVAGAIGGHSIELDISEDEAVAAAIETVERRHGPIDILVNCAGNLQNTDRPEDLSMQVWDRITAVHLRGTYMVTVALGTRMAQRGRGAIVTIASSAGMRSTPLHAYAPAKAGLISQTECLAVEWGRSGVRVNAVSPGFVLTPGVSRGVESGMLDADRMIENSALGRLVEPEEIAGGVLFLASDLARAITGVNLPIDAGWLAAISWPTYGGVRPARSR